MAAFNCSDTGCGSVDTLSKRLMSVFDPVAPNVESMSRLACLAQGSRPLIDCVVDFQTLAEDSTWCSSALFDHFYLGLNEKPKKGLALQPLLRTLDELIDTATRLKRCFQQEGR